MKQVTLNVADDKLQTFLTFIEDLNYIEVVEEVSDTSTRPPAKETSHPDDFMSLAGMWKDRDISAEELRAKAWPSRK